MTATRLADLLDGPLDAPKPYRPELIIKPEDRPNPTPEWRAILDDLYNGIDTPADEAIINSARVAADHLGDIATRASVLQDIAKRNREEVATIREQYKNKELFRTPREAIDKLNELKVQEKFLIPDSMAHNMQALISRRNQKENGKRFKSKRIESSTPVLQVWRTR